MKTVAEGYRVAVVGASSLQGKELLNVLEERKFPVSRLVTFEADEEEPDLPIVDLQEHSQAAVADENVSEAELDFAFLAARPASPPSFLRRAAYACTGEATAVATRCFVVDLAPGLAEASASTLSAPSLDRETLVNRSRPALPDSRFIVSAHPATIVLSSLLLPLASQFELKWAAAQIFSPVSDIGPRAIEELQKQTVSLLSFQKIPRAVFGAQLAFNLLPRLGRSARSGLAGLENVIRDQLRQYLSDRAPLPALRFVQVPVFYSLAVSLYVETAGPASAETIGRALAGGRLRLRRLSDSAPSQVEATGEGNIQVDAVLPDAGRPAGFWLWATVDNLRLAAENAVEIAETLEKTARFNHREAKAQRLR